MKQAEILTLALSGRLVAIGEFRDWEAKVTPNGSVLTTTYVDLGRERVQIQAWLKKGSSVTDAVRPAFVKGDLVVCDLALPSSEYGVRAKGTLHKFEK
jgi:hypothetical protein